MISSALFYSSVPNRGAGTFINFEEKSPPAQFYFGLHILRKFTTLHIHNLKDNFNIPLNLLKVR